MYTLYSIFIDILWTVDLRRQPKTRVSFVLAQSLYIQLRLCLPTWHLTNVVTQWLRTCTCIMQDIIYAAPQQTL
jgi:hypothetical protein